MVYDGSTYNQWLSFVKSSLNLICIFLPGAVLSSKLNYSTYRGLLNLVLVHLAWC